MPLITIPIWKEAPFLRIVIPFVAGILIQFYFELPVWMYVILTPVCAAYIAVFASLQISFRFRHYWLAGVMINILLLCCGGIITCQKNTRHQECVIPDLNSNTSTVLITLEEPLVEKNKSFKAVASLHYLNKNSVVPSREQIIVYFQKDTSLANISYNSCIAFSKLLQEINNTGNPGAFDYRRYCAMQHIYHQVYLKHGEYIILPEIGERRFGKLLLNIREKIIAILRKYLPGKKEVGLAEALLIGYKDDLDKTLLQSYSKTGVVHIIAISGLHLGLIYWLLNVMFRSLGKNKKMRLVKALLVICGLWLFSLVAGGAPSVMRSTVMFSFIALGGSKKISVYNSLALSAFVLVCYHPFWIWDTGFQLSYVAVLSIVIFMRPVYNWFYLKNKLLDLCWKLLATSIAAQILTTPVIIYYFHQFPNYFLITNLVAIPLSSAIILGELLLCAFSVIPALGQIAGSIVGWLIHLLNAFIEHIENMPFVTTDHLQLSLPQLMIAYITICAFAYWLLQKDKTAFITALCSLCCFITLKTISGIKVADQQKIIVYHIPKHQAISFIQGRNSQLICDTGIINNNEMQKFNIIPTHAYFGITSVNYHKPGSGDVEGIYFGNQRILVINGPLKILPETTPLTVDLIIISGNPRISIPNLLKAVRCKQIIFDSSNPAWKINTWKTDCISNGVPCYSVSEKGAFILNLN